MEELNDMKYHINIGYVKNTDNLKPCNRYEATGLYMYSETGKENRSPVPPAAEKNSMIGRGHL